MRILFVNYGNLTTNSLSHIGPYASALARAGHETVIAVPSLDESLQNYAHPEIPVYSFEQVLANPQVFSNSASADIIHAWTPREVVRQFCLKLLNQNSAKLIVHLEDDEQSLSGHSEAEAIFHSLPGKAELFVNVADGVTLIIDTLRKNVVGDTPTHLLQPGIDLDWLNSMAKEHAFSRADFAIPDNFKIVVYPGGATRANRSDLTDLFLAINEINKQGTPCILLKTGFPDPVIRESIPPESHQWIRDLGFLDRQLLPALIDLADIVIQPGKSNAFNEYRLPSKLPEFLCLGKPLITSKANLGHLLENGHEALLLQNSRPSDIAYKALLLFNDQAHAKKLGGNGKIFGEKQFNLSTNTSDLICFYDHVLDTAPNSILLTTNEDTGKFEERIISQLETKLAKLQKPTKSDSYLVEQLCRIATPTDSQILPSRSLNTSTLQVYFPNKEHLIETASLRLSYFSDTKVTLRIPFAPPSPVSWLRIDPSQTPGKFTLTEWRLLNAENSKLFTSSKLTEDSYSICGTARGTTTPLGIEVQSDGEDPQVHFSILPEIPKKEVAWLEIDINSSNIPRSGSSFSQDFPYQPKRKLSASLIQRLQNLYKLHDRRSSLITRIIDRYKR